MTRSTGFKALTEVLGEAAVVAKRNDASPVALRCDTDGNVDVWVSSGDLRLSGRVSEVAMPECDITLGSAAVQALALCRFENPDVNVTRTELSLAEGRSKVKVQLSAADAPIMPAGFEGEAFQVNGDGFDMSNLATVSKFASRDPGRSSISGVSISSGDSVVAAASDSYGGAKCQLPIPLSPLPEGHVMLSVEAAVAIASTVGEASFGHKATKVSDGRVTKWFPHVAGGADVGAILSRVEQTLGTGEGLLVFEASFDVDELAAFLTSARSIGLSMADVPKDKPFRTVLQASGGVLTMLAVSDIGETRTEVECEHDADFKVSLAGWQVRRLVSTVKGVRSFRSAVVASSGVVLKPLAFEGDVDVIVMPVAS